MSSKKSWYIGKIIFAGFALLLISHSNLHAAWVLNGYSTLSGTRITLTPNSNNYVGSFWSQTKLDLTQNFDFTFNLNMGTGDGGGAGICFVIHNSTNSTAALGDSQGTYGNGWMGTHGIWPAVAVEVDDSQDNSYGDPTYDHVGIDEFPSGGAATPNHSGAAPVAAMPSNGNVETGTDYPLRITWNAASKTMTVYFNGVQKLTYTKDIASTFFSGASQVYVGFTGSTGSKHNLQSVVANTAISSFKTVNSSYTVSGSTVVYTIKIINTGAVSAYVSQIQDVLPGNFSYITGSSSGPINSNPAINGQTLTWNTPFEIATASTATFIFKSKAATTTGTFYNSYTVAGENFTLFSSGNTAPVAVLAPLMTMTKTADNTTYAPGATITYTVKYQNQGQAQATTLVITDSVPPNTAYVTGSLRMGVSSTTYSNANPLTDAAGDDAGEVSGGSVIFKINSVGAADGVTNSGSDEGNVFFKVKVQ